MGSVGLFKTQERRSLTSKMCLWLQVPILGLPSRMSSLKSPYRKVKGALLIPFSSHTSKRCPNGLCPLPTHLPHLNRLQASFLIHPLSEAAITHHLHVTDCPRVSLLFKGLSFLAISPNVSFILLLQPQ